MALFKFVFPALMLITSLGHAQVYELAMQNKGEKGHCSSTLVKTESGCQLLTNSHCVQKDGQKFDRISVLLNNQEIPVQVISWDANIDLASIELPKQLNCASSIAIQDLPSGGANGLNSNGYLDGKLSTFIANNNYYSLSDIYEMSPSTTFVPQVYMRPGMSGGLLRRDGQGVGILQKFKALQQGIEVIPKSGIDQFLSYPPGTQKNTDPDLSHMDGGDEITNGGDFDDAPVLRTENDLIKYLFPFESEYKGAKPLNKSEVKKFLKKYADPNFYAGTIQWNPWRGPTTVTFKKTSPMEFATLSYPIVDSRIEKDSFSIAFSNADIIYQGNAGPPSLMNAIFPEQRPGYQMVFSLTDQGGFFLKQSMDHPEYEGRLTLSCFAKTENDLYCTDGRLYWLSITPGWISRFFTYRLLIKSQDGTLTYSGGMLNRR